LQAFYVEIDDREESFHEEEAQSALEPLSATITLDR
jgi:hypothetical protein